ncbi:MAG: hypothetical protein R2819_11175 [Allomuricauda sp.]
MKMFVFVLVTLLAIWNSENPGITIENDKFPLIGIWVNNDSSARGITKCDIQYKNDRFLVHVWGACTPQDCDWGEQASNLEKKDTESFHFLWASKFAEREMEYEIIEGKLKITTITRFLDNSGRPSNTHTEFLTKE